MIKHIGKQGDRKVAIVFREVPGEEHMALVIYPEVLPVSMHDSIMKVIESDIGQQAENLGDALFRSLLPDGRPMLQTLHVEGMIKKVQAKTVVVTPNATSHVNLAEMNGIIRKMKLGEDAVKQLADLDANAGMTGKVRQKDDFGREVGAPSEFARGEYVAGSDAARRSMQAPQNGALDDASIAANLQTQAARMAAEAKSLLAESERLMKEAAAISGAKPETKAKSGRPKKVRAADAA